MWTEYNIAGRAGVAYSTRFSTDCGTSTANTWKQGVVFLSAPLQVIASVTVALTVDEDSRLFELVVRELEIVKPN